MHSCKYDCSYDPYAWISSWYFIVRQMYLHYDVDMSRSMVFFPYFTNAPAETPRPWPTEVRKWICLLWVSASAQKLMPSRYHLLFHSLLWGVARAHLQIINIINMTYPDYWRSLKIYLLFEKMSEQQRYLKVTKTQRQSAPSGGSSTTLATKAVCSSHVSPGFIPFPWIQRWPTSRCSKGIIRRGWLAAS